MRVAAALLLGLAACAEPTPSPEIDSDPEQDQRDPCAEVEVSIVTDPTAVADGFDASAIDVLDGLNGEFAGTVYWTEGDQTPGKLSAWAAYAAEVRAVVPDDASCTPWYEVDIGASLAAEEALDETFSSILRLHDDGDAELTIRIPWDRVGGNRVPAFDPDTHADLALAIDARFGSYGWDGTVAWETDEKREVDAQFAFASDD